MTRTDSGVRFFHKSCEKVCGKMTGEFFQQIDIHEVCGFCTSYVQSIALFKGEL